MQKENRSVSTTLGSEKISTLLIQYATPAIAGMTAASLYNVVDSIFIGHGVGALGISGLALTFPIMNMAAAFGSLVGVGASTLLSIKLGQKDYEGAHRILGQEIVLNICTGVIFGILCLLYLDSILYFFGASEATIGYAREYMQIILIGNTVTHLFFGQNAILRSSGFPRKAMYATLFSVFINIALNPIFIFALDWGIRGAAVATILSQLLALAYQCVHFSNRSHLVHFRRGIYKLKGTMVKEIFSIGMSPFLMNLCSCLIVILINRNMKTHGGDLAIGAYGIVNRIATLFVMVIMGLNQGMQPIAGFNYGAKLQGRVIEVTKLTMIWAVGISTTGWLLCELFPSAIARIFTTDAELTALAVYGLRVTFLVFPVVGYQMVTGNFFLSIGMARKSIFLSLTRQMIFLVPFLLTLPHWLGATGVWLSMPLADFIGVLVAVRMLLVQFRRMRRNVLEKNLEEKVSKR
ncbi:MAG: MATE family efflux transporter [Tannerellaceae bacterium]|jgi:putative MATE family efflux protein|nr:MATE family efflux transporter [Tannerellaceae bacterium]